LASGGHVRIVTTTSTGPNQIYANHAAKLSHFACVTDHPGMPVIMAIKRGGFRAEVAKRGTYLAMKYLRFGKRAGKWRLLILQDWYRIDWRTPEWLPFRIIVTLRRWL
jgi:hypothetical protein